MTVQQDHPTTALAPARVPAPRRAGHDALTPMVVRGTGAWTTPEERLMCRLMMVMMLSLGLLAALGTWLSARVW